ncbi:hypothetical protein ABZ930_31220 [Streptomyces sp. NPDC046716]|uniref:alpha/beta hydrolase family protein n=1 Tax=Streptomyces sp. NPDC046716 TaxID=3157093 RepID=UPI0033EDDBD6
MAALVRQAAAVADPELTADTPSSRLPLGLSAAYWLDLRAYDPVATAAQLACPMLILQGGRDYQVTVADDLPGWQRGLADRHEVTIRIHDDVNHLFFSGSGRPDPAEYARPGHVASAVVDDIATWVARRWGRTSPAGRGPGDRQHGTHLDARIADDLRDPARDVPRLRRAAPRTAAVVTGARRRSRRRWYTLLPGATDPSARRAGSCEGMVVGGVAVRSF